MHLQLELSSRSEGDIDLAYLDGLDGTSVREPKDARRLEGPDALED